MQDIFQKYNLELSDLELEKFERFLEVFIEKNSQINLSAIRQENDIIEKHFVDSIMLCVFLDFKTPPNLSLSTGGEDTSPTTKVVDMWTGWGFPGIPLAIVNADVEFTLIDSVWKKVKCVWEFADTLWLKNVSILHVRAEDIGQDPTYREQYDFVTSRATAYFPTLLEYTIPLLKIGGVFAAYKLDDKEELKTTKKALHRLGAKILKVKNYTLADQKRTIVLIEKTAKTHTKYPRKVWIPLKDPIV